MVMTRKTRKLNLKTSLRITLLAGVSSIVLAALVVLLTARTVQADAASLGAFRAPETLTPASTAPTSAMVVSATPATLASPKPALSTAELKKHRLHGIASWYGGVFNGRTTASGETFDENEMTACHATLPFGTLVRVINRINHRSVVVRITDRGDLVDEGRIIDLSRGAAEKLAMVDRGLAPVDLQVIALGRGR
jgi:rare lipoprotein A